MKWEFTNKLGEKLQLREFWTGDYVKCPKCGTWVKIPPDDSGFLVICPDCHYIIYLY